MTKTQYITTTLPYVNADPHIGFAMEIIQADILARWMKLQGDEVFFNTGTDEHGQKVFQAAAAVGKDPQLYTDEFAEKFKNLQSLLGLSSDLHFIRTTNPEHRAAAQEFWRRCEKAGDIYKKNYSVKYCVGCELEKTDSELVDGRCPIHPDKELQIIEEENYFFRFSKYGQPLLHLYDTHPDFVIPAFRLNEMRALIERGLEDFSVSRLKSKMSWGVPVPGDNEHVMYVWFDALVSYISAIRWPSDMQTFEKWWPVIQCAGKDQVRQQAAMWQAMLLSAGLPPSQHILIHGFINYEGQKMSKSLGNVINPQDLVDEYGTEALRYFVAREWSQFEDTDVTPEKLKTAYNAHLANGLGNLVSRIMKMAETNLSEPVVIEHVFHGTLAGLFDRFEIQKAADHIWTEIAELDRKIQETEPFKLVKTDPNKAEVIIKELVVKLTHIGHSLAPFMPETSQKIIGLIQANKSPETPLFARRDS